MAKKKPQRGGAGAKTAGASGAPGRPSPRSAGPAARAASAGMDLFDRVAWWALHLLVALVPPAMANFGPFNPNSLPLTYDQFDIVKVFLQRGFMLVAVGAWMIGLLVRGGRVRWHRTGWLVLAFLGWVALTSVLSIHPPTAIFGKYRRFEGLISFVTYAAVFFVALQYADRPSRIRSLARTLAISGFVVAAYGVTQVVGEIGLDAARLARVLVAVVAGGGVLVGLWALASGRVRDPETRTAVVLGMCFAALAGTFLVAGLGENLKWADYAGASTASLDPIRWGRIGFETNRAFSTYGNPDMLGAFLIFPFAVALGLALTERHRVWRVIYWVFTLFNVFVGLTSYVRGAWIGATVAAIALVVAYVRARKGAELRLHPVDRLFITGVGLAGITIAIVSSLRDDAVRNVWARLVSIFQFDQGSALTRFQIWEAALAAIAERPVFGWGADTFRLLFPMFKPAEYVEAAGYISVADNVHNYPLQLASGIGIPGALLLYGIIVWALVATARQVFTRGTGTERLLAASMWAAILGYVVCMFFGLSVTGCTVFMWLLMALLVGMKADVREVRKPSWGSTGVAIVGVIVLIGLVFNTAYVVADNRYLQAKTTAAKTPAAVEHLDAALSLNPFNDMYRLERAVALEAVFGQVWSQYVAMQEADPGREAMRATVAGALADAEDAYRDMIEYVPYEYDTYVFLTGFYLSLAESVNPDYVDEAIGAGKLGVIVEPYGPAVRVLLARAYLLDGDFDKAIEELEVAAGLDSRYLTAWENLAYVRYLAGDYDGAREAYEHILARDPAHAGATAGIAAVEASAAAEASAGTEPSSTIAPDGD